MWVERARKCDGDTEELNIDRRRRQAGVDHLNVLQFSVNLQQLRLASFLLSLLSSTRLSSPLLLTFCFASVLTAGRAQASDPLAHIDSKQLRASRGGRSSTRGGAWRERGGRSGENKGSTPCLMTCLAVERHKKEGRVDPFIHTK